MPTLNLRRKIIRLESVHAWAVPGAGLGQLGPSRHPAMAGEVIKPIQQGMLRASQKVRSSGAPETKDKKRGEVEKK